MINIIDQGAYLINGTSIIEKQDAGFQRHADEIDYHSARRNTIAFTILSRHNLATSATNLKIRFDSLASHDITYVGIIQTARASGLQQFPVPYVLTNCHNSLCAVGGTINEDDHIYGLSAAQKYGGIFVPPHQAVIHQYVRETMTGCGRMILGSDSHTRYGALGTMGIGEGGPELVKQLLEKTYDITYPEVIGVYLKGAPRAGVGPQDVALAIIGAVFKRGFVTNKVLEFVGPGIAGLSVDYRNGIDVMTTETTCLSSIWQTDDKVRDYYETHGRPEAYCKLEPGPVAYYDGMIVVELDRIEPMIAMPFHPSHVYKISDLNHNAHDILHLVEQEAKRQIGNPRLKFSLAAKIADGRLVADQAIVAGCAGGTYENIVEVASIIDKRSIGNQHLALSLYPASQPIFLELVRNGAAARAMTAGAVIKTAFCGPCFGAGDVPAHGGLSIRHTTRNFPNREGSKPGEGQISSVALMDARSIAATVLNGGRLTAATEIEYDSGHPPYHFDREVYANRVYNGFGQPETKREVQFGPNIADWPKMVALTDNLILRVAAVIMDPVTTTDELIPSGETSSFRSNPQRLAEFTLSRKEPKYVARAKATQALEFERRELIAAIQAGKDSGDLALSAELTKLTELIRQNSQAFFGVYDLLQKTGIGSVLYAVKPGDGSAREQAASSQKVLGGWANIAREYATKRYRSNLINWGMLPFTVEHEPDFSLDDLIFIPDIHRKVLAGDDDIAALLITPQGTREIELKLHDLSQDERDIILKGSLINFYA